jgi:hypothetical protein
MVKLAWNDMPKKKEVNDSTNGEKNKLRDEKPPSPLPIRATVGPHIFDLFWGVILLRAIASDLCGKSKVLQPIYRYK